LAKDLSEPSSVPQLWCTSLPLYTAVTTSRKLVVIVGSKRTLAIAVKNNRTEKRYTCLKNRLAVSG
jgi:hypothetical protein